MNLLQISALILVTLLSVTSLTMLGLISNGLSWAHTNINDTAIFRQATSAGTIYRVLAYMPQKVYTGDYWFINATAIGGMVDAPLIIFFSFRTAAIRKFRASFFEAVVASFSALRIGVAIAALAFSIERNHQTPILGIETILDESNHVTQGGWTILAWTCQMKGIAEGKLEGSFGGLCKQGVSSSPFTGIQVIIC